MGFNTCRSWAGIALAVLASGAAAETPASEPGYYVGVLSGRIEGIKDSVARDGRPSLGANLGYRFNETLSAELFVRTLSFELFNHPFAPNYEYPDTHVGVALLAAVPLAEQFKAYGRVGLGRTSYENSQGTSSGHRLEPSAGLGLSYDFGKVFGLKLEATRFTRSKVNSYTLGGEWRF